MSLRYATFFVIPYLFSAQAQFPAWQWATGSGGNDLDRAQDVCIDGDGNVVITGFYDSEGISFGSTDLLNAQNNSTGDVFVAKMASDGTVLWAQGAGSVGMQRGLAVASNAQNEVLVAGLFENSIAFGSTTLTSVGSTDVFLVKYDAAGTVLWATSVGGPGQDIVSNMAVGPTGAIAIAGTFGGATFTSGSTDLINADDTRTDVFVATFSGSGVPGWADGAGGTEDDVVGDVGVDPSGNVIVCGFYKSGGMEFGTVQLTNANDNYNDLFLVKYDANGAVQWAKGAGGIYQEHAFGLGIAANGDIVMAGHFDDVTLDLDGTVLSNTTINQSWFDMFVARYTTDGTLLWAQADGGEEDEFVTGVDVDEDGNALVGGDTDSDAPVFGPVTLGNAGGFDAFVAKYDPAGDPLGARVDGGGSSDRILGLACGPDNMFAVTGYFSSDPMQVGAFSLPNDGDNDVWVAAAGLPTGLPEELANNGVSVYPSVGQGAITVTAQGVIDELRILDASGRLLVQRNPRANSVQLHIAACGVHTVVVKTGNATERSRFVVQR